MKRFRELREDWRIGKLEKDIFQQECAGMKIFDDSKWTNKQEEYHKKREEMLDYDSFEEFVSTVFSKQPSQESQSTYRDQLLNRLEIEFDSMTKRTLKKIYQRLATQVVYQRLMEGVDCEQFCFSPIQFMSCKWPSHSLLLILKDLRRGEFMDIQPMKPSSDDPEVIPLFGSSSDDSDSWTGEFMMGTDDEQTDHSVPKALVVNPFSTQKYRNAPEEHKDGWKKVKAVVDTGASHFITADPSMLTNQRTSKTMISTAASGSNLQARSRGTVNMQFDNQARTPFLHTTDAIYSPNCGEETLIPARQVCHNGDLIGVIYNNKIEWHRKQNVRVNSKPLGIAWLDGQKDLYVQEVWVKQNDSEPKILIARVFYVNESDLGLAYKELHERLGHIGFKDMSRIETKFKKLSSSLPQCDACIQGKSVHLPRSKPSTIPGINFEPGEHLALDLHGKHVLALNQPTKGSARYALLVIDCRHVSKSKNSEDPPEASSSGFIWVEPLMNKSKESVLLATDSAIADATARSGRKVRYLNTDGESAMRSKAAQALFRRKNIKHTMGAPYTSLDNSFAERAIGTITYRTSAMMMSSFAPPRFWFLAERYAVLIYNNTPVMEIGGDENISRRNILEGHCRPIELRRVHPFGIMVGIVLDKKEIDELERRAAIRQAGAAGVGKANKGSYRHKAWKGIFLGYTDDDLRTAMVFAIKSKRIKCIAYDNCRWVYGNMPWKVTNPSTSWDSWKDATSSDDTEEESDSENADSESDGAEEPEEQHHGVNEHPGELSESDRERLELEARAAFSEPENPMDENWDDVETEEEIELKDEAEEPHLDFSMEHPRTSARVKARSDRSQANYERHVNELLDKNEKAKRDKKKYKEREAKKISAREARRDARTAKLSAHLAVGGSQESTQIQNEALKAKILKRAGTGQAWRNAHREKNPLSSQDSDFEKVSILLTTTKPTLDAFMKPPESRRQMLVSPFKAAYIQAEKTEIETHIKNGTWELIDPTTLEIQPDCLRVRWVYALVQAADGTLKKVKARLCAMGCFQSEGHDYDETFSAVTGITMIRIIIQILNLDPEHESEHWDVTAAFINAKNDFLIYMKQPEGYIDPDRPNWYCLLHYSLYGEKQSGRNWYLLVKTLMIEAGAKMITGEESFYVFVEGEAFCLIAVHVDDFIVVFNKSGTLIKERVFKKFQEKIRTGITNLGEVSWILKMAVERDREAGIIKLHQSVYAEKVDRQFMIEEPKFTELPYPNSGEDSHLTLQDWEMAGEEEKRDAALLPIRSAVGCLWWLAHMTRFDIQLATQRVAKFVSKPTYKLWRRIMHIFKYLHWHPSLGLIYKRPEDLRTTSMFTMSSDASFNDAERGKSSTGAVIAFFGATIINLCSETSRVVLSTGEAETSAFVQVARNNERVRGSVKGLGIFKKELFTPTQASIDAKVLHDIMQPGANKKKSRFWDLDHQKLLEYIQERPEEVKMILTESKLLAADWNTKFMNAAGFLLGLERIMGEMVYQGWFDNKGSATAKTARILGEATAQLPLLQEPKPEYVLNDYGYDDDEKGISINMISVSHTPPQQMSNKDLFIPTRVLDLRPDDARQIADLWRMLGATVRANATSMEDKADKDTMRAHKTDFKAQWLELNQLLNESQTPLECLSEVNRLLRLYQVLVREEAKRLYQPEPEEPNSEDNLRDDSLDHKH